MPSATTTEDELEWSLTDPAGMLSCPSSRDISIGVDLTIVTSAGRQAKVDSPNPAS